MTTPMDDEHPIEGTTPQTTSNAHPGLDGDAIWKEISGLKLRVRMLDMDLANQHEKKTPLTDFTALVARVQGLESAEAQVRLDRQAQRMNGLDAKVADLAAVLIETKRAFENLNVRMQTVDDTHTAAIARRIEERMTRLEKEMYGDEEAVRIYEEKMELNSYPGPTKPPADAWGWIYWIKELRAATRDLLGDKHEIEQYERMAKYATHSHSPQPWRGRLAAFDEKISTQLLKVQSLFENAMADVAKKLVKAHALEATLEMLDKRITDVDIKLGMRERNASDLLSAANNTVNTATRAHVESVMDRQAQAWQRNTERHISLAVDKAVAKANESIFKKTRDFRTQVLRAFEAAVKKPKRLERVRAALQYTLEVVSEKTS